MANKKPEPKGSFSQAVRIGGAALVAALPHASAGRTSLRTIVEAALLEVLAGVKMPSIGPERRTPSKRKTQPKTAANAAH